MKKIILLLFPILVLSGCKSYIQVFETSSTNTQLEGELFVYETDTVKITYGFWADKGILSFAVYNKLDVPIYIDWKKSSFIDNSNKLDYWIDEERSNSVQYYGTYFYRGPIQRPEYMGSQTVGTTSSTKVKVERITFIPPHSNYYRSQFYLLPNNEYKFDIKSEVVESGKKDHRNRSIMVFNQDFSKATSPLVFRNFLAISLEESFDKEFYVDNEFYLSNVKEMDSRHFKYRKRYEENFTFPFKKQNVFYKDIPREKSVERRKEYSNKAVRF